MKVLFMLLSMCCALGAVMLLIMDVLDPRTPSEMTGMEVLNRYLLRVLAVVLVILTNVFGMWAHYN